jgi:hypothetical protein
MLRIRAQLRTAISGKEGLIWKSCWVFTCQGNFLEDWGSYCCGALHLFVLYSPSLLASIKPTNLWGLLHPEKHCSAIYVYVFDELGVVVMGLGSERFGKVRKGQCFNQYFTACICLYQWFYLIISLLPKECVHYHTPTLFIHPQKHFRRNGCQFVNNRLYPKEEYNVVF